MPPDDPMELEDLIDEVNEQVEGDDTIGVGDLIDQFGKRAFGPLIAVPALVVVSPVGMIPGVPATLGAVIILIAVQQLLGLEHPWVPQRLEKMSVPADKWRNAEDKIRPWAKWIDTFIAPRMIWLSSGPAHYVISLIAIGLSLLLIPLEVIPFAVFLPGCALLMFGLAISANDGLLALLGLLATGATAYLCWVVLL